MRVVGYGRCSTADQARNGVSIEVQRRAVEHLAESNSCKLIWLADEGVSGGVPPEPRKKFRAALALLEAGEVGALIFTKVDRASRCTEDFARLIRLSEEQDWRLIVSDVNKPLVRANGSEPPWGIEPRPAHYESQARSPPA